MTGKISMLYDYLAGKNSMLYNYLTGKNSMLYNEYHKWRETHTIRWNSDNCDLCRLVKLSDSA